MRKSYDIYLYSIDGSTKTRWWIGKISNVFVVFPEESIQVYKKYEKKRWLREMVDQLLDVNVKKDKIKEFKFTPPEMFSTIKFKISDIEQLDPPKNFSTSESAVSFNRYILINKKSDPVFEIQPFNFNPGHKEFKLVSSTTYEKRKIKIDYFHNRIQTSMFKQLANHYGESNVGTEQFTGNGTKIDLVVKNSIGEYIFYEIKTSNSLISCIREALSQLLEYAYYPNVVKANKLIIVSHNTIDTRAELYLRKLKEDFNIPVFYQRYSNEEQKLDEKLY